jgi:hypothetical protein
VNRSRTVVALTAAALLTTVPLAGCSVFQHSPTQMSSDMPASVLSASPASSGSGPTVTSPLQPSATPTIAVPVNAPVPPAVPGYTLTPASATVLRKFQTVAGKFNGVFAGLTVRTVTKGTDVTGTAVLLGLHPELVGNTTVERGLLPGMMKGMAGQGAKTSTQKVGTQDVAVAATKTKTIVAWYKGGTVVLILGSSVDPAPTLTFVKAYLGAR